MPTRADDGSTRAMNGPRSSGAAARPTWSRPSLRLRVGGWTVAVFLATMAASTAFRIADERRRLIARETEGATSLLDQIVRTPEMTRSVGAARAWLQVVEPILGAENASVAIVPESEPPPDGLLLAIRPIQFPEGRFELRYILSQARFATAARRAVSFHAIHGALTLLLLLLGMEWILRRRLLAPLHQLSHQVNHMGAGGGWQLVLPETDAEILEIRTAVRDLGPSLAGQVDGWIQGEKRAAVALALAHLRERLREPQRRALMLLGDLQAAGAVTASGKAKARALTREIEAVSKIVDDTENEHMPFHSLTSQGAQLESPQPRSA